MREAYPVTPEVFKSGVTAAEFCEIIGSIGEELIDSGKAQWRGNDIVPYQGPLVITNENGNQGRVTQVKITVDPNNGNRSLPIHQISFKSDEAENGNYEVSRVVFSTLQYNFDGKQIGSSAVSRNTVNTSEKPIQIVLEKFIEAYEQAVS